MAKTVILNIDLICEDIMSGLSYRAIADKYNTNYTAIHNFLSKENHSVRANEARRISADTFADKAEKVLIEAEGTIPEISRARELASHYRWAASKKNPREYGDKVDITSDGKPLAPTAINIIRDNGGNEH